MDGAGTDDDEKTAILISALHDFDGLIAPVEDGLFRFGGLWDFVLEEIGWCEGIVAADCGRMC